jgi:gliding motility-associated-like protein
MPYFIIGLFLLSGYELYGQTGSATQHSRALGSITLNITVTNTTCAYNNGSFVALAGGGTPPYTYRSNAAQQSNASGIFANLAAGTYDISVTDANGNSVSSTASVGNVFTPPYLTSQLVNPSGCFKSDGSIILTANGGTAPFMYSLDDGSTYQTGNVFSGLGSGLYHVFVKDANGCVTAPWSVLGGSYLDFQFYFIKPNALALLNPTCGLQLSAVPSGPVCGNDGFIEFYAAEGGSPPYTYSLDGINFSSNTTNGYYGLAPGHYTVYARDATGLTISEYMDIPRNCPVTATETIAACGQKNGSITVTNANGLPPYTYSIDGIHFQSSSQFTGLAAGYYTVIAKDGNGATNSAYVNIGDGCPVVSATATAAACGQKNGTIHAAGASGMPPYTYSIDGTNFQSSDLFTGLASATYNLYLKDANGSVSTTSVEVFNECIAITTEVVNASCGNSNGTIVVNAANGTGSYQYSLDGTNFQSSNLFTGLLAGSYTVTVMDGSGVESSAATNIENTAGPLIAVATVPASCLDNDGAITITQQGGMAPFQYSIDGLGFQANGTFSNLDTGTRIVFVKDANGCLSSRSVTIPLTNDLTVDAGSGMTICEGKGNPLRASSNGTSFSWIPQAGLSDPSALDPVASPDTVTLYTITATRGICSSGSSVTVLVNAAPKANAGQDTIICFGKSVQLEGSGGIAYHWSPSTGLDNADIADPVVTSPPASISYGLKVTDGSGCQSLQAASVKIVVTPPAKVFAGDDTAVLINQPLQLHAVDVDNSGFTQYQWTPATGLNNPFSQDPTATVSNNILYTVTASTPEGCSGTGSIALKLYSFADIYVPNAFTPNGDGHNDLLKALPVGIREFKYFVVYNRWGQQIFRTQDPGIGWDGLVNGVQQGTGAYVWMVMGIDYKGAVVQRRGTAVLIR